MRTNIFIAHFFKIQTKMIETTLQIFCFLFQSNSESTKPYLLEGIMTYLGIDAYFSVF